MAADDHAMYEHPPIALVAAEVRFPGEIGAPIPLGVQRALGEVLGEGWVIEQIQRSAIAVSLGPAQPVSASIGGAAGSFPGAILRFAARNRTAAVALTAGSVTVETTRYGNWPQFRSVLEKAVSATEKLLRPAGVTRIGVRYIDEIRVRDDDGTVDWNEWLSPAVLPPAAQAMSSSHWPPHSWTGTAQYQIGPDRHLVLRYGPQPGQPGFVVNPDGPLRRPGVRPAGPFFLLDFDAFWQPSVIPGWNRANVLETCDQLRKPVRALFDEIITDRLVTEVFSYSSGREASR